MSKAEFHGEKRQEVAGNPQTDTVPTVNVSINIQKPTEQTSQTQRLDENTLREFDKKNKNFETSNIPSTDTTRTNVSNDDYSLKEKTKNSASDTYNKGKSKIEENTSMSKLIKHAQYCLQDFMNPKLNVEKQIPIRILSNAFGLVFLTELKGSFGVGSSFGTGLIIARKPNHQEWTGPCAIGMGGLSIGFQAGVQKIEHIIVIRDQEVLKSFTSKGQLKLGGDVSFAVGPLGRDAQISLNVNDKDYSPIYSYSMSKGLHMGASLDGQVIIIRDDCNETYYGKRVSAEDILYDKIDSLPSDKDYSSLTTMIEEYTQKQGQLTQEWFTNEENRQNLDENEYFEQPYDVNFNENEQRQKQKSEKKNENLRSEGNISSFDTQRSKNQMSGNINKEQMQQGDVKNKKDQRLNMDRLLKHACFNLERFMSPKLEPEKQIPVKLLNNAYGLIFLTEFKGGIGIGGSKGTGFIITHKQNEDECSYPCAIGMGGVSVGLQIGGQKTEHIFILRDEEVLRRFINKGQLNLGGDMSFSIGPLGRDVDIPLNVNDKGFAAIYSYSMANGAYVGMTLESQMLTILEDWNEEYFGRKVTAKDILFDHVKPQSMVQDRSYQDLINLLREYKKNQGKITNDSYWNEQDRKEEEYWQSQNTSLENRPDKSDETNIQEKDDESGNMNRLLSHACHSLESFVNPNTAIEKRIPVRILKDAQAIVFLTEIKAGFVVGASVGKGIILARRRDTEGWTGPCAIALGGMSVGWLAGAEKTNHVFVFRDTNVLETFLSKGQLKLGGDVSFAIGPLGRDANIAVNVNDKGYAPVYSYSMSKGAYLGASLEGHLITIRDDTNEEYYGTKVKSVDILHGLTEPLQDKEYTSLCEILDKCIGSKGQNFSKDTKVVNESDVTRVVTDVHKEQTYHENENEENKNKNKQNINM